MLATNPPIAASQGASLVGMRLVALVDGGYAEYAIADRRLMFPLPASIDFGDSASFLVQGVTAWNQAISNRSTVGKVVLLP